MLQIWSVEPLCLVNRGALAPLMAPMSEQNPVEHVFVLQNLGCTI